MLWPAVIELLLDLLALWLLALGWSGMQKMVLWLLALG